MAKALRQAAGRKSRRLMLKSCGAGLICLLAATGAGMAQDYPDQPITLIYPFPPGGGGDAAIRLLADGLQAELHQPVVVVNKAGGSGMLGLQALGHGRPDGYTFAALHNGLSVVRKIVQPDLAAAPEVDLQPVAVLWEGVSKIAASPNAPFKTLEEMISYAKEHPGDVTLAMGGMGSTDHISALGLMQEAGIDLNLVSYNGSVAAIQAASAGEVMAVITAVALEAQVKTGQLLPMGLAVSDPTPLAEGWAGLSSVGISDFHGLNNWMGLYAPVGTPPEVVEKINQAVIKVYGQPEIRAKVTMLAGQPVDLAPAAISQKITDEIARNRDLVTTLDIQF